MLNLSIYAKLFAILIFCLVSISACRAKEIIVIKNQSGEHIEFKIQIAKTPQEQSRGLMYVESMPNNEGMIFIYRKPVITKFWMKNTLIPLDILYFNNQNILIHIEHSAKPHDLSPRGPDGLICNVLEINGGEAKKHRIELGAKLITNINQECLQSSPQ